MTTVSLEGPIGKIGDLCAEEVSKGTNETVWESSEDMCKVACVSIEIDMIDEDEDFVELGLWSTCLRDDTCLTSVYVCMSDTTITPIEIGACNDDEF